MLSQNKTNSILKHESQNRVPIQDNFKSCLTPITSTYSNFYRANYIRTYADAVHIKFTWNNFVRFQANEETSLSHTS